MNNFFQNAFLSKVFEIMTFDFDLEEKRQLKTTVYMNASNEWIKKWKNQPIPHPILGVTAKYVCNITTMRFNGCWKIWWIIELKSASYSPSDRKNVALYTVTI